MKHSLRACTLTLVSLAPSALADVTLLTQQRTINALTSYDAALATVSAPGFAPFVTSVTSSAAFPAAGGGTGNNTATTSINCLVDPNAISASGSLAAAGGFALVGGAPSPVFGEAAAIVIVDFQVLVPTPFVLAAMARPSDDPNDEYELELSNLDDGFSLFAQDETMPALAVNTSGMLMPGRYRIEYRVELTGSAAQAAGTYGFSLQLPSPGAGATLAFVGTASLRRRRRG